MVYPDFIKKQLKQNEKTREKLLKDIERVHTMQLGLLSPTYALLKESNLNTSKNSILFVNIQNKFYIVTRPFKLIN